MKRNPVLVLTIALPLVAVVAGLVTVMIAVRSENPPLDVNLDRWARPVATAAPTP